MPLGNEGQATAGAIRLGLAFAQPAQYARVVKDVHAVWIRRVYDRVARLEVGQTDSALGTGTGTALPGEANLMINRDT